MTHTLKTWPAYFDAVKRGEKAFEVRRDDRGFQKGDVVILQRTREEALHEIKRDAWGNACDELKFRIGYILTGGQFGIQPGYIVMQLQPTGGPNE